MVVVGDNGDNGGDDVVWVAKDINDGEVWIGTIGPVTDWLVSFTAYSVVYGTLL